MGGYGGEHGGYARRGHEAMREGGLE